MLVLAQRASGRILEPAAATLIQKAWVQVLTARAQARDAAVTTIGRMWHRHQLHVRKTQAAVKLQTTTRRCLAVKQRRRLLLEAAAAVTLQAASRRLLAVALRRDRLAAMLPSLTLLQARARGMAARRRLHAAVAAARRVQACWRMVRAGVVKRRLAGAASRLRRGVELGKYRAHGVRHERRGVNVFVSDDLQQLCWTCAASGKTHAVPLATVSAVCAGVKTRRLKAQERRCEPRGAAGALLDALAPALPLPAECALSLLTSERAPLDLVAPSATARDAFLRDVRALLTYAHHLDHTQAVAALRAGVRRGSLAEVHTVRARAAHQQGHVHRTSIVAAAA